MRVTKSKRLRFSIIVISINFLIFIYGITKGADLSDLGVGLAMVNTPLIGFVVADTWRPSGYIKTDTKKDEEVEIFQD